MGFLVSVRTWFQGKKAIIGGSILILAAAAGAFYGKLSPIDALTVAGFGLSVCGISAKGNRILAALQGIATAGVDLRTGNKAGALAAVEGVALDAVQSAAPALSVTVAGSDTAAVRQAATDLAMQPAPPRVVSIEEFQKLQQGATTK